MEEEEEVECVDGEPMSRRSSKTATMKDQLTRLQQNIQEKEEVRRIEIVHV